LIDDFLPNIEPVKPNQPFSLASRVDPKEYAEFYAKMRKKPSLKRRFTS